MITNEQEKDSLIIKKISVLDKYTTGFFLNIKFEDQSCKIPLLVLSPTLEHYPICQFKDISFLETLKNLAKNFNDATIIYTIQNLDTSDNISIGDLVLTLDNKNFLRLKINVFNNEKLAQITSKEDLKILFEKIEYIFKESEKQNSYQDQILKKVVENDTYWYDLYIQFYEENIFLKNRYSFKHQIDQYNLKNEISPNPKNFKLQKYGQNVIDQHRSGDMVKDRRQSLLESCGRSPGLLSNFQMRFYQPSIGIVPSERQIKPMTDNQLTKPMTVKNLDENIKQILSDTSKMEANLKSELASIGEIGTLHNETFYYDNIHDHQVSSLFDESFTKPIERSMSQQFFNLGLPIHYSPNTEKILQSPFEKIFSLSGFEYQDDLDYSNLRTNIMNVVEHYFFSNEHVTFDNNDDKRDWVNECQPGNGCKDFNLDCIQNLGISLLNLIKNVYIKNSKINMKYFNELSNSAKIKEVVFCLKKPIRYNKYPIYGADHVFYTGFTIMDKPQGFGTLSDKFDNIYYKGDFQKGFIHSNHAVIFGNQLNVEYEITLQSKKSKSKLLTSRSVEREMFLSDSDNDSYIENPLDDINRNKQEKIMYEGNIRVGKREGIGKLYHRNGTLKYYGNFENDDMEDENGILYFKNGCIYYKGRLKNGMRNGSGADYYQNNGLKFKDNLKKIQENYEENVISEIISEQLKFQAIKSEGTWLNNVKQGKFKEYYFTNGLKFCGEYIQGMREGLGKEFWSNGNQKYSGEFVRGQKTTTENSNNKAEIYNDHGDLIYCGQMLNGTKHGTGNYYYNTGIYNNYKYVGEFDYDQLQGEGILYDFNGVKVYAGGYTDGRWSGHGILYNNATGKIMYDGKWLNGKRDGKGKYYWENGNLRYSGNWIDDKKIGVGSSFYENSQLKYKGMWNNGMYEGEGKFWDEDGELIHKGKFFKGKMEIVTNRNQNKQTLDHDIKVHRNNTVQSEYFNLTRKKKAAQPFPYDDETKDVKTSLLCHNSGSAFDDQSSECFANKFKKGQRNKNNTLKQEDSRQVTHNYDDFQKMMDFISSHDIMSNCDKKLSPNNETTDAINTNLPENQDSFKIEERKQNPNITLPDPFTFPSIIVNQNSTIIEKEQMSTDEKINTNQGDGSFAILKDLDFSKENSGSRNSGKEGRKIISEKSDCSPITRNGKDMYFEKAKTSNPNMNKSCLVKGNVNFDLKTDFPIYVNDDISEEIDRDELIDTPKDTSLEKKINFFSEAIKGKKKPCSDEGTKTDDLLENNDNTDIVFDIKNKYNLKKKSLSYEYDIKKLVEESNQNHSYGQKSPTKQSDLNQTLINEWESSKLYNSGSNRSNSRLDILDPPEIRSESYIETNNPIDSLPMGALQKGKNVDRVRSFKENLSKITGRESHNSIRSNNQSIFKDGEFIGGRVVKNKRTGWGKFIYNEKSSQYPAGYKYEGNFKEDKFDNFGTICDENGNKRLEGIWKDGKLNGKGCEYSSVYYNKETGEAIKIYEGEFVNNKKQGRGILFNDKGSKTYDGCIRNELRWGKGKSFLIDKGKSYLHYYGDWFR